ncbi:MAG TPA: hypothetical protein VJU61_09135 [Polyangiaceae bacterium]|nr:hypothetical protein [Polyangiaceae bacterium]
MNSLALLTDASLHSELKRLTGSSNTLTAQLLEHLGEVEARGIHRERACSSLYTYCVYELRMSEDEAQRRCRAARLARQFPILLEMLAEASLHLTGILLLGPHLTSENSAGLLARARFRTKREIERLVAEIAPGQEVPSRIVPLCRAGAADSTLPPLDDLADLWARPRNTWAAYVQGLAGAVRQLEAGCAAGQAPPRTSEGDAAATSRQASSATEPDREAGTRTPASDAGINARQNVNPPVPGSSEVTAGVPPVAQPRYKVQFTADQAYIDLLEEARDLLQHELPTRDLVAVQRRALELLVHHHRQRKYAASEHPRPEAPKALNGIPQSQPNPAPEGPSATPARSSARQSAQHARHIPANVRREVWQRDEGRCTYLDARGQRCREQSGLEFHHQHPYARGGPSSSDNLALRCRSHNTLAAEQDFGRDIIRRKRARSAALAEIRAGAVSSP